MTNSLDTPHLYTAVGDFQSELGCAADGDPTCLRSWLQDPDGDGTWVLRNHTPAAGHLHVPDRPGRVHGRWHVG